MSLAPLPRMGTIDRTREQIEVEIRLIGRNLQKAVNGLARAATRSAARSPARARPKASARKARKWLLERCPHGLMRGTCAICLQIEDETLDLQTGKLAPEERLGKRAVEEEEEEEED